MPRPTSGSLPAPTVASTGPDLAPACPTSPSSTWCSTPDGPSCTRRPTAVEPGRSTSRGRPPVRSRCCPRWRMRPTAATPPRRTSRTPAPHRRRSRSGISIPMAPWSVVATSTAPFRSTPYGPSGRTMAMRLPPAARARPSSSATNRWPPSSTSSLPQTPGMPPVTQRFRWPVAPARPSIPRRSPTTPMVATRLGLA